MKRPRRSEIISAARAEKRRLRPAARPYLRNRLRSIEPSRRDDYVAPGGVAGQRKPKVLGTQPTAEKEKTNRRQTKGSTRTGGQAGCHPAGDRTDGTRRFRRRSTGTKADHDAAQGRDPWRQRRHAQRRSSNSRSNRIHHGAAAAVHQLQRLPAPSIPCKNRSKDAARGRVASRPILMMIRKRKKAKAKAAWPAWPARDSRDKPTASDRTSNQTGRCADVRDGWFVAAPIRPHRGKAIGRRAALHDP